jgi:hypothetical protein
MEIEIDIDAGFQRLLLHFKDPHIAANKLNAGVRINEVRLLEQIPLDFRHSLRA